MNSAVRALASSNAVRTRLGTPQWTAYEHVVQPVVAAAKAELSAEAFAAQWADGGRRDPFAVLETTLAGLRSPSPTSPLGRADDMPHVPVDRTRRADTALD